MTSIKFKLRLSTISGKPATLYIQLIHKREVKTITLPYKLYPYEWNNLHEEVIFFQAVPHRYHYLKEIDKQVIKEKKLFSLSSGNCVNKRVTLWKISCACTIIDTTKAYSRSYKKKSKSCKREEGSIRPATTEQPLEYFILSAKEANYNSRNSIPVY